MAILNPCLRKRHKLEIFSLNDFKVNLLSNTNMSFIYGQFSSRDAAHQALERLPSSLRSASPWIRSFRDIQALSAPLD